MKETKGNMHVLIRNENKKVDHDYVPPVLCIVLVSKSGLKGPNHNLSLMEMLNILVWLGLSFTSSAKWIKKKYRVVVFRRSQKMPMLSRLFCVYAVFRASNGNLKLFWE